MDIERENVGSGKAQRERLYESQSLKYQDGAHAGSSGVRQGDPDTFRGSLGLSFVFIKDVVPLSMAVGLGLVFWSWIFLGAAILLTLFSFIASYKAFEIQKEVAFEYYINEKEQVGNQTKWALITRYLTYLAGGCL